MFIPANSQVGFEGVTGRFASPVFGLSRWFQKGSFVSGRVSGLKMKWPLVPAMSPVAHAIQPPQRNAYDRPLSAFLGSPLRRC
jgi:hypothetical protein